MSPRDEKQRGAACDLRVALFIVVPAIRLIVVLYEFIYLQKYTACTTAGDRLVAEQSNVCARTTTQQLSLLCRSHSKLLGLLSMDVARSFWWPITATRPGEQVLHIHNGVLVSVYIRHPDEYLLIFCGLKCVYVLLRYSGSPRSIFVNAAAPDNLKNSIYDQFLSCKVRGLVCRRFCEIVGEDDCHCEQLVSSQIDAVNVTVTY